MGAVFVALLVVGILQLAAAGIPVLRVVFVALEAADILEPVAVGIPVPGPLLGPVELLLELAAECPGLVRVDNGSPVVGSSMLPGVVVVAVGNLAEHYRADKPHFLAARDPETQLEFGPEWFPQKYKEEGEVQQGEQQPFAASCMGCCLGK